MASTPEQRAIAVSVLSELLGFYREKDWTAQEDNVSDILSVLTGWCSSHARPPQWRQQEIDSPDSQETENA